MLITGAKNRKDGRSVESNRVPREEKRQDTHFAFAHVIDMIKRSPNRIGCGAQVKQCEKSGSCVPPGAPS